MHFNFANKNGKIEDEKTGGKINEKERKTK